MFDQRAADRVQRKYHTPILFAATTIDLAAVGRGIAQAEDRWYLAGAATGIHRLCGQTADRLTLKH
jgi:hypothetical protein